jgi:hypothetical protein
MFFFGFQPTFKEPEDLDRALNRIAQVSRDSTRQVVSKGDLLVANNLLDSIGWQAIWGKERPLIHWQALEALISSSRDMVQSLTVNTNRLQTLDDRWSGAVNQDDADATAKEPLDFGLKAMFVLEGIYRVLDQHPDNPVVQAAAISLARAYDAYDEALLDHVGILCTLADGDGLESLRKTLPEASEAVPWWLDGALEDAAAKLVDETEVIVEDYAKRLGDS